MKRKIFVAFSTFVFAITVSIAQADVLCSNKKGYLSRPALAPGTPNAANPIKHIIVIMQENHSFDNYFGRLNQPQFYGSDIDGLPEDAANVDANGQIMKVVHAASLCPKNPEQNWNTIHEQWDNGKMDGFAKINGAVSMSYFDERDIPFYYDLANTFAVGDRYFSSVIGETFPNRFFLMAGTAFGHIENDIPHSLHEFSQKTIFDALNDAHVSWKIYSDVISYPALFEPMLHKNLHKIQGLKYLRADLRHDRLPQVAFIDSSYNEEDEHPSKNIQIGQFFVASRLREIMQSKAWHSAAIFMMYDEEGGFYEHVAPPEACVPDSIAPMLKPDSYPAGYDHLGMRVPFVAISPFAKHHYVSHVVYDHTSVLRFIEDKFNVPALTNRDANANSPAGMFDYAKPDYAVTLDFEAARPTGTCTKLRD